MLVEVLCQLPVKQAPALTRHRQSGSVLIIPTFQRPPPLPVRSVGRGQQQLAAFTRFRVCERSRDDWIPPAFGTNPAKDKQATSVNTGPQDRCDGGEN